MMNDSTQNTVDWPAPTWSEAPDEYEARVRREARSVRTVEEYARQWRFFEDWAGPVVLPLDPVLIARYVEHMGESKAVATIRLALASIVDKHKEQDLPDPTKTRIVQDQVSAIARKKGTRQKVAPPMGGDAWARLRDSMTMRIATKRKPHLMRDFALMWVMRDTGQRISAVLGIRWGDVGHSGVLIRRSKTDQEGKGRVKFLSRPALSALRDWQKAAAANDEDFVFPMSTRRVRERINLAVKNAGLRGNYSCHSFRRGTAIDLMRAGASDAQIMDACDWKKEDTMRRYTEAAAAEQSAVAVFLYDGAGRPR